MPAAVRWLIYGIYVATLTVLAVACHRLVLLGPSSETLAPKLRWGLRETKFVGWIAALTIILMVGQLLVLLVTVNLPMLAVMMGAEGIPKPGGNWQKGSEYLAFLIGGYVVARCSLVLPATAVDGKASLRWAWRLSARNGWRLVVIVGALPTALSYCVGLVYRRNATTLELVTLVVLGVVASTLEIVALSLSYQELRGRPGLG
jgi:hypothetical protein